MENREIWFDDSLDYFNNELCDEDKKCCKVEQSQPIVVCETTDIVTTVKFKHIYRQGETQTINANKDAEYQEQAISYAKEIIDNTVSGIQKDNLDCQINNNDVLCHIDNDKKFKISYNSIATYKTYDEFACANGEQSSCKQLRQKEAAAPAESAQETQPTAEESESAAEAELKQSETTYENVVECESDCKKSDGKGCYPKEGKVVCRDIQEVEQEIANVEPEGEIKEEDTREEIEEESAEASIEEETVEEAVNEVNDDAEEQQKTLEEDIQQIMDAFNAAVERINKQKQ